MTFSGGIKGAMRVEGVEECCRCIYKTHVATVEFKGKGGP